MSAKLFIVNKIYPHKLYFNSMQNSMESKSNKFLWFDKWALDGWDSDNRKQPGDFELLELGQYFFHPLFENWKCQKYFFDWISKSLWIKLALENVENFDRKDKFWVRSSVVMKRFKLNLFIVKVWTCAPCYRLKSCNCDRKILIFAMLMQNKMDKIKSSSSTMNAQNLIF